MVIMLLAVYAATVGAVEPQAEVAATQPDDAALRDYLSGNGLLNRGLYEMAAADYRRFLAAHADHEKAPIARYGLAVCLFRTHKPDAAADELAQLQRVPRFAFAAEVGTMLGQCRIAQKRYADAAAALARVVKEHADHDLADDAAAMWIEALYRDGKSDQAVARHAEFLSRWPKSPLCPRVEYFCGLAHMAGGGNAKAAERFDVLLKEFPADPLASQASLLLAQCLQDSGPAPRAIEQYRRVLRSADGPQSAEALYGLASLLLRQNQADEAGRLLDRFLEKYPKHPRAGSARLLRGRAWFEQGKFDRATSLFEEVVHSAGADDGDADRATLDLASEAAYWIAKGKLRQGDAADAARRFGAALARFPRSALRPEMMYDRAVALSRSGDDPAAAKELNEFRSQFPKHALAGDAMYLLAACELRAGRTDVSRKHCDEFAQQCPRHEMAAAVAMLSAECDFLAGRYEPAAAGYQPVAKVCHARKIILDTRCMICGSFTGNLEHSSRSGRIAWRSASARHDRTSSGWRRIRSPARRDILSTSG